MIKEFKEFALKGNLIDLAVAFVLGAAFTRFSASFIEDLFMPVIGSITPGGLDFSNLFVGLSDKVVATDLVKAKTEGAVFAYGNFITVGLNFFIVAFAMFLVVKAVNKAKKLAERQVVISAVPDLTVQEKLLAEIRDLLKQKA